jgi:hypothetical protein
MRYALAAVAAVVLNSTGCTLPGYDASPGHTALTIRVTAFAGRSENTLETYTLRCDPPSGTAPHPAEACAALRDYRASYRPANVACGCVAEIPGDRSAVISGRLDGRPFHAELGICMCGFTGRDVHDLLIATGLRRLAPEYGTISGRVFAVGGPAPGAARPLAGALVIVKGHDADGVRIRSGAKASSWGTFRVNLPAGRYTVRTLGFGPHHSTRVQVSPHGTVRVRLVRDIR